jgi:hypothetical protein
MFVYVATALWGNSARRRLQAAPRFVNACGAVLKFLTRPKVLMVTALAAAMGLAAL